MTSINSINKFIKHQRPGRIIAGGFALVILIGALILMLPVSHNEGINVGFTDSLFTSASAVCVTGLVTLDTADTFSVFGRIVICILIQIGGLGVATVAIALFLTAGGRMSLRSLTMIKESLNISSYRDLLPLFYRVLIITICIEASGAALSLIVFSRDYAFGDALGISVFHSVSAFNNAGFDILGGGTSLIPYQNDLLLNLITMALIILGGIGFLVMIDISRKRSFKKLTLHSKAVIVTTIILIIAGALLLKLTVSGISWLGAFFQSVSTRTAGFSSYDFGQFSTAGLFICILLMVIGASPGSTGGGIKTTTVFTIFCIMRSISLNRHCTAFRRRLPSAVMIKAFTLLFLAVMTVSVMTLLLCAAQPNNTFMQNFFEVASAYGTAGLSTGITGTLTTAGKYIIMATMFAGRIGMLTLTTLWGFKAPTTAVYTEESIPLG